MIFTYIKKEKNKHNRFRYENLENFQLSTICLRVVSNPSNQTIDMLSNAAASG